MERKLKPSDAKRLSDLAAAFSAASAEAGVVAAQLRPLLAAENKAEAALLAFMIEHGVQDFNAPECLYKLEKKPKPSIIGWPALCAFIYKTKSFELLQKRLGVAAVLERHAAGEAIPGIKVEDEYSLKRVLG